SLLQRIIEAPSVDRQGEFDEVKTAIAARKPSVTSISLRYAMANGQDYREEFLGCMPIGIHFSTPEVTGGTMTQEELNSLRSSGEMQFKFTMLLREDALELADLIRAWMRDPSEPFPVQYDDSQQFHYCKTRMECEHFKYI